MDFENLSKPQNSFTAAKVAPLGVIEKHESKKSRSKSHSWNSGCGKKRKKKKS